jgi:hypothetical protein
VYDRQEAMITKNVLPRPAVDRWALALAAALLILLALLAAPAKSQAACTLNAVACENQNTGDDPSTWQINGSGDPTIQGYATQQSVTPGSTINFKIKSDTTNYRIDILRLGYYNGNGARRWATNIVPSNPTTNQPACKTYDDTGLIDCGNWSVSASWAVPSTAVSGVYIAYLHRTGSTDPSTSSHIMFVVRNDTSHSQLLVQTSDATMEAYNTYGGNSLYTCTVACPPGDPAGYKSAFKVSFNRPSTIAVDDGGRSSMFNGAEYPLIRFLERNGYDVSYFSQLDTEERGSLIKNHKTFVSQGHDEYDSANQRTAVTGARDAGVNLAYFTANELFWKTRYEPSQDGTNTADRTLVAYKDTHFTQQQDPVAWTGTWRDDRWAAASENVTPENALTGQSFTVNSGTSEIVASAPFAKMRIWRNTPAASLTGTQTLRLGTDTLGYEWDEDIDNGFRPAGEFDMSSTTVSGVEVFDDYGSYTKTGTATHSLTMYKAPSGARVFATGTVQWAWGLDEENVWGYPVDTTMQQVTINVLADLGAQPATLMSGLVSASASIDTTAPTPVIRSIPTTATDGSKVTISGTATDAGGGQVAGVEVSTDGGTTWHPATGTTSWSYAWIAHGSPTSVVKVRAVDDSGNLSNWTSGNTVTVTCPCSLWGDNVTPSDGDSNDPLPVEVGMKFKSDTYGQISAIRFYKAAANTGTHTGSIWSTDGTRLAQVTFTSETASGWQTATLSNPVSVLPGQTYIVSYFAPNGHYVVTPDYFYRTPSPGPSGGSIADSSPLHVLRSGGTSTTSTTNGAYMYTGTSSFPSQSSNASNYWVDVKFSPTAAPGTPSSVTATAAGKTSADVRWTAPSTGGAPTTYKITPYIGTTAQPALAVTTSAPATSKTVTGLTTGTTYAFTVTASNPAGDGPASAKSNTVTPLTAVIPTAPLSVTAIPATRQAQISWSAPQSDGDAALTTYIVTPYIGTTAQPSTTVSAASTSATITDLTDGSAYTFKVQAVNSVGTGPASTASNATTPQATLFEFSTPANPDSGDTTPVEVGTKFKADYNGTITGIRFYKAAANTGIHIGSLWSSTGTRLAQVTFSNESASGWQTATLSSPVSVTAGTTYVVSVFDPSGHYSASGGALSTPVDNGMLHTIADSVSPNGVFAYTNTGTFPTGSYNATNYSVDVMYAVPVPGTVTNVTGAQASGTSVALTWSAPASGGPITAYRITPYVGTTAQATTTVAATTSATVTDLTNGTGYQFTVTALNANGAGPESAKSVTITPSAPQPPSAPTGVTAAPATKQARVSWTASSSNGGSAITGYTVTPYDGSTALTSVDASATASTATVTGLTNGKAYTFQVRATNGVGTGAYSTASAAVTPEATLQDFATPSLVDSGDTNGVELGMKFTTDFAGQATGVRFYKAAANTGTHVGSLWSATGSRLANVTFTNETASGWQSATFSSPVTLTPGTTYIVSYNAPKGHYSVTPSGLSSGDDNAPLHALADSTSPNGVFAYGPAGTFPNGSFNASDYAVDVLFDPAKSPGAVTGVTAIAASGSATVSWTAPSTGGPVTSYKITPYVGTTAQTPVKITGTPPATTKTIGGLTSGTAYTFTVTASNASGDGPESANSAAVTPASATAPGTPGGVTATPDASKVTVAWTAPSSDGGSPITGYVVTPYQGEAAQAPTTVDGATTSADVTGLTNGTNYTFTVAAKNAAGTGTASAATPAVAPLSSIFEQATPTTSDAGDSNSVVLGLKFAADRDGTVSGVRFYKSAANTGTHVGALWAADHTLLRSATFTNETTSGWQSALFPTPVAVTANTTYIVSYLAPNGHYAATGSAFSGGPVDNGPLHALADFTSPNGVFLYSGTSAFPTDTWNATNYWVDVLFD